MLTQRRLLELAMVGLQKELAEVSAMLGLPSSGTSVELATAADVEQAKLSAAPLRRTRTVPVVRPRAGAGKPKSTQAGRKTRTMTAEGRAAIAAAQKKRWDAKRQLDATPTNATPLPAPAA